MILKLMKHELIRKKNIFLAFIAIAFLIEAGIVFMYSNKTTEGTVWALVVFFFLVSLSAIFVVYDNVKLLSDDLNKKSGYMLFLTPNSGYTVMGAKMIIGFCEFLLITLLLVVFGWINFNLTDAFWHFTTSYEFLEMQRESLMFDINFFGPGFLSYSLVSNAIDWFALIITIYLAIVLRKTLLSNVKYKGLMSFLVFIALNVVIGIVTQTIFSVFFMTSGFGSSLMSNFSGNNIEDPEAFISFIMNAVHLGNLLNLIIIGLGFWACGYLLTKRVDL